MADPPRHTTPTHSERPSRKMPDRFWQNENVEGDPRANYLQRMLMGRLPLGRAIVLNILTPVVSLYAVFLA